jgi:hypothetical protein
LKTLEGETITVDILQETKIGLVLGDVKKKGPEGITKTASSLLAKWKKEVRAGGEKRKRETPTKEEGIKKRGLNCKHSGSLAHL